MDIESRDAVGRSTVPNANVSLSNSRDCSEQKIEANSLHVRVENFLSPDTAESVDILSDLSERTSHNSKLQYFIHELFERQVARTPESIALVDAAGGLSYWELNRRVRQMASALKRAGVGADQLVGVCADRSIEMVVGLLAALKAGGAYVPLDPRYPAERLQYMLEDSSPRVVLLQSRFHNLFLKADALLIELDDGQSILNDAVAETDEDDISDHSLAYVIYTSGSTGRPKGAMNEHRAVVNRIVWMQATLELGGNDVVLQKTPYSFDVSVWEFFLPLMSGATLVMARPQGHKDPAYLRRAIELNGITTIHFVPSMLQSFLEQCERGTCKSLRYLVCSGEALPSALRNKVFDRLPQVGVYNLYGPTEAAVDVTVWECKPDETSLQVPIGRPIANLNLYVLDRALTAGPAEGIGELFIGGVGVGRGYWRRPELTAERFVANPFVERAGARMYRTGDLGRWLPDGSIEYLGRNDFQVKIRGYRVELGEIEARLMSHPGVKAVAVIARPDYHGQQRLIGYVIPDIQRLKNAEQAGEAKSDSEIVHEWKSVFEQTYSEAVVGPTFAGWNSSYTGRAIPDNDMLAWVTGTVQRILALKPHRLLEVGCGVGLLVEQIAPHCAVYKGTDLSTVAIERLKTWVSRRPNLSHVQLEKCSALEMEEENGVTYDTIILNSVVQYFPDLDYLSEVLSKVARWLSPGGRIFIGDVRTHDLLGAFHSSVQLMRAAPATDLAHLRRLITLAVDREKDLVINPEYFLSLRHEIPELCNARVLLKREQPDNELTRYRYDVILENKTSELKFVNKLDWKQELGGTLSALAQTLQKAPGSAILVSQVPNLRLARDLQAQKLIETLPENYSAAEIRATLAAVEMAGEDPDNVWRLGESAGYQVDIGWHVGDSQGCFDVYFSSQSQTAVVEVLSDSVQPAVAPRCDRRRENHSNDPWASTLSQQLIPRLREYLKQSMPEPLIPADMVLMKQFPLTPSGKLDRGHLPEPQRDTYARPEYEAPHGEIEETLATVWEEILRVDRVGRKDNFFELGGHSLLVAQLVNALQRRGFAIEVLAVFEGHTLASVAGFVKRAPVESEHITDNSISQESDKVAADLAPLVSLTTEDLVLIESAVPGGQANIQEILPLLSLQEGILFHHTLNQDYDIYVSTTLLGFESRRSVEAYIQALRNVIQRHDALRVGVFWEGLSQPVQVIHREAPLMIESVTLDPHSDPMERLQQMMDPAQQWLDIRQAPLLRVVVATDQRADKVYALLKVHHLVNDRISQEILLSEIVIQMRGVTADLPLPVPYSVRLAKVLSRVSHEQAEGYFRASLQDLVEPVAPFGILDTRGAEPVSECSETTDEILASRVYAQARRLRASTAAIVHSAWSLVVAATTGLDDVVFGTVLSGRLQDNEQTARVVGMLINTLPLRLKLSDISAQKLLEETHRKLVELVRFEPVSLSVLRGCSGLPGSVPLFTALLNFTQSTSFSEGLRARAISEVQVLHQEWRTNLPLVASVHDSGDRIRLTIQADRRIPAMQVMHYFRTALESLVEALEHEPNRAALGLEILPRDESARLPHPSGDRTCFGYRGKLIQDLVEEQVERRPESVAVSFGVHSLTYESINRRANQLARRLLQIGVGVGKKVAIYVERGLDIPLAILGTLKAGAAYVPLDPIYPIERLHSILDDAQPDLLLTSATTRAGLEWNSKKTLILDSQDCDLAAQDATNPVSAAAGVGPANLAYVIYTSGSTGHPKGVMISHYNVTRLFDATASWFQFDDKDVWTLAHSFAFDFSVWEIWGAIFHGGRLVVVPQKTVRAPDELYQLICREGVTVLNQTPGAFVQLSEAQLHYREMRHSLRTVIFGGETLEFHMLRSWISRNGTSAPRLVNMYGITETTVHVTYYPITNEKIEAESGSVIGQPIPDLDLRIVNSYGRPMPVGITGEIYVGGDGVGRGYLNRPDITAERFIADPFSDRKGDRMYKTGDLGRVQPDGSIEYLGRNDHQVKLRGFRIELGDIEAQIARHEAVKEVIVLAREEEVGEKYLVAYVVARTPYPEDMVLSAEVLRSYLVPLLPDYMIPSAFVLLPRLPLTPNGKVDRAALPVPGGGSRVRREYEEPTGGTEADVARLWEQLLRVPSVGRNDDFFLLGGNSLLALRLVSQIRQRFNETVSVSDVYRMPTLAALAARISGVESEDEAIDLMREATLDASITSNSGVIQIPARAILVTGVTGFVGRFLLAQLLKDTDAKFFCLVRGTSQHEVELRLKESLRETGFSEHDAFQGRIQVVRGDLRATSLGLEDRHYREICAGVDSIFHCATSMNHLETYAAAKDANVQGMRELLKVAVHSRPKLVNYISTLSVFGKPRSDSIRIVDENSPIEGESHLASEGYAASKWVSDELLIAAKKRGIPCNLLRLGLVWADSRTGRYDERQREHRLLKSCLLCGYGIKNYRPEMTPVPVDYVVQAISYLAGRHAKGNGTFHIAAPQRYEFQGLFEIYNEIPGIELQLLSPREWVETIAHLHAQGEDLPIVPLIENAFGLAEEPFADYWRALVAQTIKFDNTLTRQELEEVGIVTPPLDREVLQRQVENLLATDPELQQIAGTLERPRGKRRTA